MLHPMVYSKFRHFRPDDAALEAEPLRPYPFVPTSDFRIITLMDEPCMQVGYEDWFKGHDVEWVFFIDVFMIVTQGEAEITWRNPPDFNETGMIISRAGDMYLCPRGAHLRWHILSDEPYRRVVLDIPNGGYEFEQKKG